MFLSVVFFMTGLLGFLTFTVICSQYKSNRKVNFYLLVLILFASSRFFLYGIQTLISFSVNEDLVVLFRSFGCAVFACVYLYFKSFIDNRKNPVFKDLYHFVIPVLFGFLNLLMRKYSPSFYLVSYFLFALIPLFYLFLSYVELKNKVWSKRKKTVFVGKQKMVVRRWTLFFFFFCVLAILRLEISLFLDIYIAGFSDGTSYLWISAILCVFLFFKILLTPTVLHINSLLNHSVDVKEDFELVFDDFWMTRNDVLVENNQELWLKERVGDNLDSYIYDIERLALDDFCFRNPTVSLRDFAIKLEMPKSHLVYFFKYHSNVSFIEFKRTVRIYDAIILIDDGFLEMNTLDALSKKVGFSSFDLFLNCFKEISGVLPQEYIQKTKEAC